jgi:hypothetical protein
MRKIEATQDANLAGLAGYYARAAEPVPQWCAARFMRRAARLTPAQRAALVELERRRQLAVNEPCADLECGRRALPSLARAGMLERSTLFPFTGNGRRRKLYRLTAFGVALAGAIAAAASELERRQRDERQTGGH